MTVNLAQDGGLRVLTLARPERRNALSRAVVLELGRLGRELCADPGVRCVVLTGEGQAFCAGADLKERIGMSDEEVRAQLRAYRTELAWLGTAPFPVVAAVNGAALGGGLELALSCDLRIAAQHAVFALTETSLGIIPAAGGTQRLPRLVGEAKALELILLATRLDAAEASRIGLVNRVTEADQDLLEETKRWLAPVLEGAPIAQRAALEAIRASSLPLAEGLEVELAAYERCLTSEDRREALRAFAEKRKPKFEGR
jgi:enoyl-CoA hydratase/carnithine racemase